MIAHPETKKSGVEWIGQIPIHWHVRKFRYCGTIPNGQVDPRLPQYRDQTLVAPNHIESGTGRLLGTETADEQGAESGKYLFKPGEVLYSKIRPELAKVCLVEFPGLCSADMYPIAPHEDVSAGFLAYQMTSTGFTKSVVLASARVAMPKVNRDELGSIPLVIPPLPEQRAIAGFLDRKTAQIDAVVAKKQRLIERLQEKRQALISHAVTKGLDPHARMKDSGIEWLGQIPAHWDASPLKRFWNVTDCKHLTVPFVDDGIPVASIGEVQDLTVNLAAANKTLRADYLHLIDGGRKPAVGDVIYSRNATVGAAALVHTDEEFCMGQDVCLISSIGENQEFLLFQLRSPIVMRQLDALMVGATFKRINVGQIKELLVCRPPGDEQAVIAQHCWRVHRSLILATDRLSSQIAKLQEYRQTLISAAVTGKIDVTKEAAC